MTNTIENIPLFHRGDWLETPFPKWQDGEEQTNYLKRIQFYDFPSESLGNNGLNDVLSIYCKTSGGTEEAWSRGLGYLVDVEIADQSTIIAVTDHLSLLMLCNYFAPLIQASSIQAVFDGLFQDESGRFDFERIDALKRLINALL